ncbi:MAG: S8 family serine peptidase [Cytophagales bacterium]|nr:S8 family serine peptidase [Cytophagales bacterium]
MGLTGKGVKVGIIDGGFLGANEYPSLQAHFNQNRVQYYKVFVTPDLMPYTNAKGLDNMHGTEVWEIIGGINPMKNVQFGLETNAIYYLARTDHAGYEMRKEEKYMIQAIEEMTRLGVNIVNISLGYNKWIYSGI